MVKGFRFRKTNTFHRYYSTYGVYHVSSLLFIEAILLYSLVERGLDLCTIGVYLAFFFSLLIPTGMSQALTDNASFVVELLLKRYFEVNLNSSLGGTVVPFDLHRSELARVSC